MAYLAYFAAGAFLANGIPHLVNGISGRRFQSPFASPPGIGESSPLINVTWGMANLILGYILVFGVGNFESGFSWDILVLMVGFICMALILAWHFGRVRSPQEAELE